jgi:hypothetical protein
LTPHFRKIFFARGRGGRGLDIISTLGACMPKHIDRKKIKILAKFSATMTIQNFYLK